MNILLMYGESKNTTGNYFKKALEGKHNVTYLGNSHACPDISQFIDKIPVKPDIFIYIDGIFVLPHGIEKLNCSTVCFLIDVHIDLATRKEVSKFFDYIFVAQKDYVEELKKLGNKNVFWLPLACDQDIHKEMKLEIINDIGFVGHMGGVESKRSLLLEKLSKKYKMNDFKTSVPASKIAEIYSQSKIGINITAKDDLNMRVFEIMAAGALLFTERINNGQDDLFEDRKNLVYYNESNLTERLDYYLLNDKERDRIAREGQKLVLEKHTYEIRAGEILGKIKNNIAGNTAFMRNASKYRVFYAFVKMYFRLRLFRLLFKEIFLV